MITKVNYFLLLIPLASFLVVCLTYLYNVPAKGESLTRLRGLPVNFVVETPADCRVQLREKEGSISKCSAGLKHELNYSKFLLDWIVWGAGSASLLLIFTKNIRI